MANGVAPSISGTRKEVTSDMWGGRPDGLGYNPSFRSDLGLPRRGLAKADGCRVGTSRGGSGRPRSRASAMGSRLTEGRLLAGEHESGEGSCRARLRFVPIVPVRLSPGNRTLV